MIEELARRITLRLEYRKEKEKRRAVFLSAILWLSFLLLSMISLALDYLSLGYLLLLSSLAYQLLFLHFIRSCVRFYSSKLERRIGLKIAEIATFGPILTLTFLSLIALMITRPVKPGLASIVIALTLTLVPCFLWEKLFQLTPKKFFFITLLQFNQTDIGRAVELISKAVDYLKFFLKIILDLLAWLGELGLTPSQLAILAILIFFLTFYLISKFLKFFIKWVLISLIIWMLLQAFT